MPTKTSAFDRVRRIGLKVAGLEEGKAWDGPCLKANKKIAACMATHKSAEPGTLVVVVGEDYHKGHNHNALWPEGARVRLGDDQHG